MATATRVPRFDYKMVLLLAVTVVVIAVLTLLLGSQFLSLPNLQSMMYQIPEFGLLALAMAVAMITGGIDLSVVSTANLAGIVAAYILTSPAVKAGQGVGQAIAAAVAAALAVSLLCGLVNGLLIAVADVPPILATLGTMMFYSGVALAVTEGVGVVGFPQGFLHLGSGTVSIIPIPMLVFVAATLLLSLLLNRTVFGWSLYLLGSSPVASRFSGLSNVALIAKTYALTGLLAGISAIIMISRVNSAKVGYGDTYLLQAILVAVLGSVNPYGGYGKVAGVVMGIVILQVLQSAFTLFAFSPYAKRLIWGVMLILVMIINFASVRYQERARSGPV